VRPRADRYPDQVEAGIRAFLESGLEAGRTALAEIAYPPREVSRRPVVPRAQAGRIFRRDRFICGYCGGRTILTSVMELVASLYPDIFPYHPNWKGGLTHPAFIARSAVIDHRVPGSLGGAWLDDDNLVTTCWPCNAIKADMTLDQLGWELHAVAAGESWDGLTRYYLALWERAGRPKPGLHTAWMRAVGIPSP
jgi:hypothetical protein